MVQNHKAGCGKLTDELLEEWARIIANRRPLIRHTVGLHIEQGCKQCDYWVKARVGKLWREAMEEGL